MTLAAVALDDKYALEQGRVFLTGVQALVRLPLMQRRRDERAGLNTGGFISGYRGSPLAGYDQQLVRARKFLKKHHVHFQPGVNEDLAATAVWGSQQVPLGPKPKYDGVFGIWYGKGPGVDRSGDVLRHANGAGTSKHGGVLALLGDDHNAVSSTFPHQSEQLMAAWMLPTLYPAGVQEYLDFGLLGWAMSRFTGLWVGFKCVTELVEASASVQVDPHRVEVRLPEIELPPGGLNIRWPDDRWSQERRLEHKLAAAAAFARLNRFDRTVVEAPRARFGVVTTGKSWHDVCEALADMGLHPARCAELGVRVYKVGMPWPLEPEGLRDFARGLEEILVVEEKRSVIEQQVKDLLYNLPAGERPRIVGKQDEAGRTLLVSHGELTPADVGRALASRIESFVDVSAYRERLAAAERRRRRLAGPAPIAREPYFCSGCPHNSSTKVPEGSRALAGIGCHFLALNMDRSTATFTQMGGEGAPWIGQQPFTEERHVFANIGDGTYYHSGLMAIRAAVAAKVNITYKILFNDAVAMTGGQTHDGPLTPWQISQQVKHEGVERVVVVTDDPDKYPIGTPWADGVTVHHRDELDQVQRELRETPGVTALIYDQTCAAEKRRRRKRGAFPDPDKRVFINDLVCEGCGDCSVQSNCVSVEPLETEFGRKRQINQSSCNKDFSCLKGFCPSFVTVSGAKIRRAKSGRAAALDGRLAALPSPEPPPIQGTYDILVTGVGGTGVVTVGALLGMAAHLEGKGVSVLDFTGLAQKNGAVLSHIRLAETPEAIHAPRIADERADLLLGCDMVVAAGAEAIAKIDGTSTHAVVNSHLIPTAEFTRNPDLDFRTAQLKQRIRDAAGANRTEFVEATALATALMGDSIATNLFMLGYAFQRGLVPVSQAAIERAIELNGVAVDGNKRTFALGRLAAHDVAAVEAAVEPELSPLEPVSQTYDELVERRVAFLTAYQDAGYARRYRNALRKVEAAERERAKGRTGLAEAAARNLFKLMAYKDEYEVARLYTETDFRRKLARQFDGELKLTFHLAPPLLARRDEQGRLQKREYGPWMLQAFRLLAKLRGLRGTRLDPFGWTAERKMERRLIEQYLATLDELLSGLDAQNHALAVEIANLPAEIRGFGHVKERNLERTKAREAQLLQAWRRPPAQVAAAE
jgi:indolepyruvate ferredoxin oxidoreductase